MLRRMVDLVGAGLGLILMAPVFLALALAVRLDSPGPAVYAQVRVGRRGRLFRLYKFRTMVADAARLGPALTGRADPRITRLGRVLRPSRLDELPQLVNVVKGDMSLVGPRPEVPSIVAAYAPAARAVLEVRPGIVGPTQLGWLDEAEQYPAGVDRERYYIEHVLPAKLQSDLAYLRTRSMASDLGLVLRVPFALGRVVARSLGDGLGPARHARGAE